jgi:hypothetical protein
VLLEPGFVSGHGHHARRQRGDDLVGPVDVVFLRPPEALVDASLRRHAGEVVRDVRMEQHHGAVHEVNVEAHGCTPSKYAVIRALFSRSH